MASATRPEHIPPLNFSELQTIPLKKSSHPIPPEDGIRYRYSWPQIDFDSDDTTSVEVREELKSVYDFPSIPPYLAHRRSLLMKCGYVLRDDQPDKNYNKEVQPELPFSGEIKVIGAKWLIRIVNYPNLEGTAIHGNWQGEHRLHEPTRQVRGQQELSLQGETVDIGSIATGSEVVVVPPIEHDTFYHLAA